MSRKDDTKAHDGQVTVNVDDFTRTRESVLVSLSNLQAAVSDLTRAYINHTNTVLNPGLSTLDLGHASNITAALLENGLLGARSTSPGAKSEVGEKKKRKRAPPDPNAPKRALTPYFLYMQHNRPIIAQELGPSARPKDVSDEGTRRWAEMPEAQKEVWKKLYADNLAVYKEKVKAYKAGKPWPEDDNTKAASQLQLDIAGASASGGEESEEEQEEEADEDEETEESSPEPVKEPTPPRANKRRRSEVKTPLKKNESPEKKKRTSARKGNEKDKEEEPPASTRKAAGADANAKRTKKKRKSEVGGDE
ncbi:putative HMG box protein [Aspergillus novofumigatus IBT 16806]|uniref:Putative HMG box protein n=1 Tax=Aspergillus novofumigatus (strain IBT 16806) TaxID=1392255 RepID=A0A2I1BVW6_ASPN1|nr:putative HMG box protein [Aspergillus novofumigatus IBT 16806]PKX89506.1 putative HMG box protein [Aspergillus novofumigatus IBT 16806]